MLNRLWLLVNDRMNYLILTKIPIGRRISDLQTVLLKFAKDKTEQIYLADITKGSRVRAS